MVTTSRRKSYRKQGHELWYRCTERIFVAPNQISHNYKHAVSLVYSSEITILGNCLKNNILSGVNVELGKCWLIQDNDVIYNDENGIVTTGSGSITENGIFGTNTGVPLSVQRAIRI